jgi:hypothetical protein
MEVAMTTAIQAGSVFGQFLVDCRLKETVDVDDLSLEARSSNLSHPGVCPSDIGKAPCCIRSRKTCESTCGA